MSGISKWFNLAVVPLLVGVGIVAASVNTALALPIDGDYHAKTAGPQALYTKYSANHALWLPGIPGGADFVFIGGSGNLNVSTVGHNLLLTGTIASTSAPANTFDVSMSFTLWSDIAASMFVGGTPEAKKRTQFNCI